MKTTTEPKTLEEIIDRHAHEMIVKRRKLGENSSLFSFDIADDFARTLLSDSAILAHVPAYAELQTDVEHFRDELLAADLRANTLESQLAAANEKLTDWERRSESCESKLGQLEANEKILELEDKLAGVGEAVAQAAATEAINKVDGQFLEAALNRFVGENFKTGIYDRIGMRSMLRAFGAGLLALYPSNPQASAGVKVPEFDMQTMDAKIWTDAFCTAFPASDWGTMMGWFSNAIMAGYDEATRRQPNVLAWAVERWRSEVAHRPLQNKHRRSLDDVWRQVIRFAGGNPDELIGPSHDALLPAPPSDSLDGED